jgi:tRNA-Thr(GGU) m(6)t(6)A37 methyltransferase TsaA
MEITLQPIAVVKNSRREVSDDFWGSEISVIELAEEMPTVAFDHISDFSHLDIIYYFDRPESSDIVFSGHPRGNRNYPDMGIFGQRKKNRPNRLGLCTVELIEHTGRTLKVKYLDAIDGTPILDIKPVFREFEAKGEIRQPDWVADLMKDYWR